MTAYLRVFLTFARNSLVRDMTFRMNFLIDLVSSMGWVCINLAFYKLLFHYTPALGADTGWHEYEFFVFLGTALLINSIVQALVMTNADDLSELVRTGGLDFVLLKPMDTQFLVSFVRFDWSSMGNVAVGAGVAIYGLAQSALRAWAVGTGALPGLRGLRSGDLLQPDDRPGRHQRVAGPQPVAIRLLVLSDQFFPLSDGDLPRAVGQPLRRRLYVLHSGAGGRERAGADSGPAAPPGTAEAGSTLYWFLPAFTLLATAGSLLVSRWIFQRALQSYRSASS